MDLNSLWKLVLGEIEVQVSRAIFKTQFAGSQLISLDGGVAKIGLPNALTCSLVESRYYSLIKKSLDTQAKTNASLIFVVAPAKTTLSEKDAGPLFQKQYEAPIDNHATARKLHINPICTFENYAVSTTNQLAYAAATAVAKSPGTAYNPLYIYGGVGVGKTHLMHAVANMLFTHKPNLRAVYCMGEEFTNEFIESIQTKSSRQFKQKYRGAQLFLVDDVQFIAGKERVQEEFFHTFNTILREGGQIILTSDRPPEEINNLEDRLRSRFEGGLTVDISPPDFELRAAIVNIKSSELGMNVPRDAAQLIAASVTDTRALEGILRKIKARVTAMPEPITPELITNILGNKAGAAVHGETKSTKRVSPQNILEIVASHFEVKTTGLKGPKRDRPLARPRQLFMYLCKTELGLTYSEIGGLIGNRDHTTVMHGVETIAHELSNNDRLRGDLMEIKQKILV